jgi:hypothetical protein
MVPRTPAAPFDPVVEVPEPAGALAVPVGFVVAAVLEPVLWALRPDDAPERTEDSAELDATEDASERTEDTNEPEVAEARTEVATEDASERTDEARVPVPRAEVAREVASERTEAIIGCQ